MPNNASTQSRMEHHDCQQQHPKFTKGPARFVVASDGSTDCLALLVPEKFISTLNNLFEQDNDLDTIQGPLFHTEMQIRVLEDSARAAANSLKSVETQDSTNNIQNYLTHQESKLRELRKKRDELQIHTTALKRELQGSRNYAHYVLETAMEEEKLMRPHISIYPFEAGGGERSDCSRQHSEVSRTHTRSLANPEDLERQEAWADVRSCYDAFEKVQARFDDKERLYYDELLEYQRGVREGRFNFPQSEFDRRYLEYGQELTGALIDAEYSFDRAKERAEALGTGSTSSRSSYERHRYEEEALRQVEKLDRSIIEAWRADIPTSGSQENPQPVDIDDFDAGSVHISDSLSARDEGHFRKRIDRWQELRGLREGPTRRRTKDIWIKNKEMPERRHSS